MAHGDSQRRGGELGDASTLLTAQIAEDAGGNAEDIVYDDEVVGGMSIGVNVQDGLDAVKTEILDHEVGAGTHTAADIVVDSSTLTGVGITAQAVFEELDDAIAAGSVTGFRGIGLAADFNYTKDGVAHDSPIVLPVTTNQKYILRATLVYTGLTGSTEQPRFAITMPASGTFKGVVYGAITQTAFTGAAIATVGSATSHVFFIEGYLSIAGTAGNVTIQAGDTEGGGVGVLAKASVLEYRLAAA